MNKLFIVLLAIIGTTLIIISLTQMYTKCPESKIIYRYIPRTFQEEQDSPVPVSEIFEDMFKQPSPWVESTSTVRGRTGEINKYFVSDNID